MPCWAPAEPCATSRTAASTSWAASALLLRSLSFEAFAVLPMPARGVSLPEVQAARLLQAELYDLGATFSGDIPAHWPSATNPPVKTAITTSVAGRQSSLH